MDQSRTLSRINGSQQQQQQLTEPTFERATNMNLNAF
jgi:hypothetical protein